MRSFKEKTVGLFLISVLVGAFAFAGMWCCCFTKTLHAEMAANTASQQATPTGAAHVPVSSEQCHCSHLASLATGSHQASAILPNWIKQYIPVTKATTLRATAVFLPYFSLHAISPPLTPSTLYLKFAHLRF